MSMKSLSYLMLSFSLMFSTAVLTSCPVKAETQPGTDMVYVVDVSGSMAKTDPGYNLRESLSIAAESLSSAENRVGVVTFSDKLGEYLPLTPLSAEGLSQVKEYMGKLTYTSGDTDIGAGLSKAVELLKIDEGTARTGEIILLTDGLIDLPGAEDEEKAEKESLTGALLAAEQAKQLGVAVDAVGLGSGEKIDQNLLGYLAERTGGIFRETTPGDGLSDVLTGIIGETRQKAQKKAAALTETETEKREETEPHTEEVFEETETESFAPSVIGNVDGSVVLKGFLPAFCTTKADLHEFFDFQDGDDVVFSAAPEDPSVARCTVEGAVLKVTGRTNGLTKINLTAEKGGARTETSFYLDVSAYLDEGHAILLVTLAAGGAIAAALLRGGKGGNVLSGSLSYYVKMDGHKIFGVPSQSTVSLDAAGNCVRLSDILDDSYLETADLSRVTIRAGAGGPVLAKRTKDCLIQDEHGREMKKLQLGEECRFRIVCATDMGTCIIVACYMSGSIRKHDAYQEEKTRLLV